LLLNVNIFGSSLLHNHAPVGWPMGRVAPPDLFPVPVPFVSPDGLLHDCRKHQASNKQLSIPSRFAEAEAAQCKAQLVIKLMSRCSSLSGTVGIVYSRKGVVFRDGNPSGLAKGVGIVFVPVLKHYARVWCLCGRASLDIQGRGGSIGFLFFALVGEEKQKPRSSTQAPADR
jgi:hypothetical protein